MPSKHRPKTNTPENSKKRSARRRIRALDPTPWRKSSQPLSTGVGAAARLATSLNDLFCSPAKPTQTWNSSASLEQEQRCSSASPPISLFFCPSVTAPSFPPGDGSVFGTGSWPFSSGPTVQLDDRSPRCRRNDNHAFAPRFRCLVALTSQSLVEEALVICLRRVQGSRWYHSRYNVVLFRRNAQSERDPRLLQGGDTVREDASCRLPASPPSSQFATLLFVQIPSI